MAIEDLIRDIVRAELVNTHTAMPGIVTKFDSAKMTVNVKPAIKTRIMGEDQDMTELVDVPVMVPSAGGYHVTFPISAGDECLVVFSDKTIDGWAVEGGVKPQTEIRTHHINDGMAIIGLRSQPRTISRNAGVEYNKTSMELRSDDGKTRITVNPTSVDITAPNHVNINNCDVVVTSGDVIAEGISLRYHTHSQPSDSDGDSQQETNPPS